MAHNAQMHDHWRQRWEQDNIGFHRAEVHASLRQHWLPTTGTVLVPLCGKSLDLRWLAERGHQVIGVELIERAIHDFFAEQRLTYERRDGELPTYVARELPITLLNGDYFAVEGLACDALYDRAALVALPPDLRRRYAAHTDGLLREGAFRLLITLEYEQALVQGPPFAVLADEVRGYWPELEQLSRVHDGEAAPPKFRAAGAALTEVTWRSPTAAVSR